jgi:cytochrome c-type biogenesis protein CcmE
VALPSTHSPSGGEDDVVNAELDLSPISSPAGKKRNRRRSIGVLVVIVLAVTLLLSQGLLKNLNYFETVDQALAQKSSIGVKQIRLEGVVKPGTIIRTATGASFWLTGSGSHQVYVQSKGTPPQLFQANIPVVVVGNFASIASLTFEGSQIMVKHSASYIAAHPSRVRAPNGTSR